ncbi:MAG: hypothetical protein MI976_15400 [Pseudomonadales bacterium]|nr:hypothetical protein [Pseudomonadales bacterium]
MSEENKPQGVVDFTKAKAKVVQKRKDEKEKALEKQFKKAMGWKKTKPKKKPPGNKGPKPKR